MWWSKNELFVIAVSVPVCVRDRGGLVGIKFEPVPKITRAERRVKNREVSLAHPAKSFRAVLVGSPLAKSLGRGNIATTCVVEVVGVDGAPEMRTLNAASKMAHALASLSVGDWVDVVAYFNEGGYYNKQWKTTRLVAVSAALAVADALALDEARENTPKAVAARTARAAALMATADEILKKHGGARE